jgi:hypothetical protein
MSRVPLHSNNYNNYKPQGEAYGEILMLTLERLLKAKNVDDNIVREACSTWNLSTNSAFDLGPRKTSGNV